MVVEVVLLLLVKAVEAGVTTIILIIVHNWDLPLLAIPPLPLLRQQSQPSIPTSSVRPILLTRFLLLPILQLVALFTNQGGKSKFLTYFVFLLQILEYHSTYINNHYILCGYTPHSPSS